MKVLKMTVLAMVVAVSGMNIYNSKKECEMSDVLLANVEALADDEGVVDYGCGGNPTFLKDQTLKSTLCPPLWLGGTHLKCKSEQGVCCDPSKQTNCDSIL